MMLRAIPSDWNRVCAALNTVATSPPNGSASDPSAPTADACGGDGRHTTAQSAEAGTFLTLDEARDDSFRSWRLAIDELARR